MSRAPPSRARSTPVRSRRMFTATCGPSRFSLAAGIAGIAAAGQVLRARPARARWGAAGPLRLPRGRRATTGSTFLPEHGARSADRRRAARRTSIPRRMQFDLTDEQQDIRRLVRDFADGEVAPGGGGARPREALPVRDSREARRARADGHPLSRGVRRRRRRQPQLRDRDRGAGAGRLERGDHRGRAHLAGHLAAVRVRLRRAEGRMDAASSAPASGSARSGSPSPRRAPTPATCARAPSWTATTGSSTARSSSSPTAAPTSRASSRSPRERATARSRTCSSRTARRGYEVGEPYRKMGWNASDTRPLSLRGLPRARGEPGRAARPGLQAVPPDARRRPYRRLGDGRRAGAGRARRGARVREGAGGVRPADLEVPGDPGEARRPLHGDRGGAPAHLQGRASRRTRAATSRSPPRRRS